MKALAGISQHVRVELNNQGTGLLQRRDFIKTIFLGVATSGLGTSRWSSLIVAEAHAEDVPFPAGQFSFRISDYPPLSEDLGSISLEIPGIPNILVTRLQSGEFVAVTSVCTHEGCSVNPYSSDFGGMHCPCHRSLFAPDGSVLNGPAQKPLYRFKLVYDGNDLITLDLVKFSYVISARVVPTKIHGRRRLSISFQTELLNNYAIMFKPTLDTADWTQMTFSETAKDDATEDLFMGTGDNVTLYVDMAKGTGVFTVARFRLLGG